MRRADSEDGFMGVLERGVAVKKEAGSLTPLVYEAFVGVACVLFRFRFF